MSQIFLEVGLKIVLLAYEKNSLSTIFKCDFHQNTVFMYYSQNIWNTIEGNSMKCFENRIPVSHFVDSLWFSIISPNKKNSVSFYQRLNDCIWLQPHHTFPRKLIISYPMFTFDCTIRQTWRAMILFFIDWEKLNIFKFTPWLKTVNFNQCADLKLTLLLK